MAIFQVIEAKPFHCGQMARLLRVEHRKALALVGVDTHRELRASFDDSYFRKAWLIDGKLAGLGGVRGTSLSPFGFVWLALSAEALKYPLEIVREARWQMRFIMTTKMEIYTTLIDHDETARRFAVFMGFHVAEEGEGARAHTRGGRRALVRYIEEDHPQRVPFGDSHVVAMGYHEEAA